MIRSIAAGILLGAAALYGCATAPTHSGPPPGEPAPAILATDTTGATFDLAAHRGKVVLIDFWATWCQPCVQASPHIQALHDRYGDDSNVAIVAIHASTKGDPQAYAAKHGYTYRAIPDGAAIAEAWDVRAFPTFIIVGRDGNIAHTKLGFYPGDETALDRALRDAM